MAEDPERTSEQVLIRLKPSQVAILDRMTAECGFDSRNAMARSLLVAVLEDDAKAHGDSA